MGGREHRGRQGKHSRREGHRGGASEGLEIVVHCEGLTQELGALETALATQWEVGAGGHSGIGPGRSRSYPYCSRA